MHACQVQWAKSHCTGSSFHQKKTLKHWNVQRSMLAMLLAVLYKLECLEAETLKWDLVQ